MLLALHSTPVHELNRVKNCFVVCNIEAFRVMVVAVLIMTTIMMNTVISCFSSPSHDAYIETRAWARDDQRGSCCINIKAPIVIFWMVTTVIIAMIMTIMMKKER